MMKFIAYYLPQFHEVKENNEWWGNGFTEWTNVKKSKALFDGHQQPKIPLDGYYDLMEKETMVKQAEYAEKYGIYGMAFYHYWFEGRHLLEKPAENLLKWKDINMNFMFCWANHDWIRSWNGTKELLLKQSYGKKKDWEDHFNYLLPFFKDPRYIKIDGMSVRIVTNTAATVATAFFEFYADFGPFFFIPILALLIVMNTLEKRKTIFSIGVFSYLLIIWYMFNFYNVISNGIPYTFMLFLFICNKFFVITIPSNKEQHKNKTV